MPSANSSHVASRGLSPGESAIGSHRRSTMKHRALHVGGMAAFGHRRLILQPMASRRRRGENAAGAKSSSIIVNIINLACLA